MTFDLPGQIQVQKGVPDIVPLSGCSGRYPVPRPLSLNLTWKVKYQVKCDGRVSYSGRLAIVLDPFVKRAYVISGRYPVLRSLTLNVTCKVKYQVKGHGRVSCSGRLAIV